MPLVLKRTKDDLPGSVPGEDYVVFSGALRLGRIHKVLLTGGRMRWHWNLYALLGLDDRITQSRGPVSKWNDVCVSLKSRHSRTRR